MTIGKQIRVSLSLDDNGFNTKLRVAQDGVKSLREILSTLGTGLSKVEGAMANTSLKAFSDSVTAANQKMVNSIEKTQRQMADVRAKVNKDSQVAAKEATKLANAEIDARARVIEGEISTNRKLIAQRANLHENLRKAEREANDRALQARMTLDARTKAHMSAPIGTKMASVRDFKRDEEAMRREIALREHNATVIGLEVLKVSESIGVLRAANNERAKGLQALEQERRAKQAAIATQEQLNRVTSTVGRGNVAEIERLKVNAARNAGLEIRNIERDRRDAQIQNERDMRNAALQTANEQKRLARDAAAEQRLQADQVSAMWKGMAQMYASTKIAEGLRNSLNKADDYNRILERVDAFGLDGSEGRKRVLDVSKTVEKANPNLSREDALKMTMSVVAGTVSTDSKMLNTVVPEIAKVLTVMTRQFPDQAHNLEDFGRNIMGVMEARGIVDNPKKMLETLDVLARALISTQGKMTVQDYETISRRGGAGNSLFKDNESILYDIAAASQLKVMGGGSGGGGGGVSSFANMQKQAALRAQGGVRETVQGLKNQIEFGMINKEQIKEANNGKIPGRMYSTVRYADSEHADKNMTKFAMKRVNSIKEKLAALPLSDMRFFNPGEDRTDDNVVGAAFNRWADKSIQNGSAREYYKMFSTKAAQHRIEAEVDAANAAPTYGESHKESMDSWGIAVNKTQAALIDLGVVVGNQLIPTLQPLLGMVTDLVRATAEFGENNPMAAKLAAIGVAAMGVVLSFRAMTGIYGTVSNVSNGLRTLGGASTTAAGAAGNLAGASQRVSSAQMATLASTARATAAQRDFANMQLSAAQKTVANASGMQRLTAVTTTLIPAQNQARVATANAATAQAALQRAQAASTIGARAMAGATRLASGAMMLMGGPIGLIITGLTVATMAWTMFGNAASEAKRKAKEASESSAEAVQNTIKRLKDDIVVMKKGENAPIVDTERAEIDILKKNLALAKMSRESLAKAKFTGNQSADGVLVNNIDSNKASIKTLESQIATREAALKELSDLAIKNAKERSEKEAKEAAETKARIEKELAAGAPAYLIPKGEGEDTSATTDLTGVFEDKKGRGNREKRDYIDPLTRALEETKGKVAAGKVALGSLKNGAEELAEIRQQVEEELEGKRKGGVFNKDRDKNKQVEKDDPRYKALVEETYQLRLQDEQKKALAFANERVALTTTEVDLAMERIAGNGVEKQTEAFRALSKELERAEQRLGAGADGLREWDAAKARVMSAQAQADAVNMAADYQISNQSDATGLLGNERERQRAALETAAATEDRKYQLRVDTLRRTEAIELAALARSNASEQEKLDAMYRHASARDVLDMQYNERRRIRGALDARELETQLQKQMREWQDVGGQIENIGASAANSFVSMLTGTLGTGRLAVGDFVKGVLTDIAQAKLKQTMAQPLEQMIGQGMNWAGKNLFGMDQAAQAAQGAATMQRTTADTMAATATTAMGNVILTQVLPALQIMAQSAAQAAGGSLGTGIGSMIGAGMGSGAGSGAVANVLFANGGIMTEFGEMQLRKYAKGGVANSPQVAIYGEGAQNEAFVPLPDGRSIPVTMNGASGQAAANVQVNVINQTSQSVNAQQGQMRFDGKQMILDVVLSAATAPGSFRSGMKDAMR